MNLQTFLRAFCCAFYPSLLLLLLCDGRLAQAQSITPIPQQLGIWKYDSSFVIFGQGIDDPIIAVDDYHMRFTQGYNIGIPSINAVLATTYRGVHYDTVTGLWDNLGSEADSIRKYFLLNAYAKGFGIVGHPHHTHFSVTHAKNYDAWIHPPLTKDIQNFYPTISFPYNRVSFPYELYEWPYLSGSGWGFFGQDTLKRDLKHRFYSYITVDARDENDPDDTISSVLMFGDAGFNIDVLTRSDTGLYNDVYHIWADENGTPRSPSVADSLEQLYDKSRILDVGVAIWADDEPLRNDSLDWDNDTAIGYTDIYLRDTAMQSRDNASRHLDSIWVVTGADTVWYDMTPGNRLFRVFYTGGWQATSTTAVPIDTCKCALYRRLVRDTVTKKEYLEISDSTNSKYTPAGGQFYEILTEVDPSPYWPMDVDVPWEFNDGGREFPPASTSPEAASYCEWLLKWRRDSLSASDPRHLPEGSFIRYRPYAFAPGDIVDREVRPAAAGARSDLIYRFTTTRLVDVSFARGRVAQRLVKLIEEGIFDSLIRVEMGEIFSHTIVDSLLVNVVIADEISHPRQRAGAVVDGLVQQILADSGAKQSIFMNPPINFLGFRVAMGDFDSTEVNSQPNKKMIHMVSRQAYRFFAPLPIPISYLNPDSLGRFCYDTVYGLKEVDTLDTIVTIQGGDTIVTVHQNIKRQVAGNSQFDHDYYTDLVQKDIFGKYRDVSAEGASTNQKGMIPAIGTMVNAFRFDNLDVSPYSNPVYNIVQTHGYWIPSGATPVGDLPPHSWPRIMGTRIPTAEEIVAQTWLSVNTGVEGVGFADIRDDGHTVGFLRYTGPESYADEYGTYTHTNSGYGGGPIEGFWLARKSRHTAVKEASTELHYIDTVVGWRNVQFRREQISVYDTVQTFASIPMLRDLKAERAKRYDYSVNGSGVYTFNGSDTIDARSETYVEATHYGPAPGSAESQSGAHFLLITNRLTWPVSSLVLSDSTVDYFNTKAHSGAQTASIGLGAIDVRRAIVVLENNTNVISDSVLVERISPFSTWNTRAAFGDTITLDWMLPGRGHFYRVTPIPSGVSNYGVAYNNAVRSENTVDDTDPGYQVTVVERDSAVWVRTYVPGSGWGEEFLVSAAADTARVTGLSRRLAHNILPAVARVRDGEALLVVWQRLDTNDQGTVEALHIAGKPDSSAIANATPLTISSPRTINRSWMKMAPAVVGFDGGWIIAWGAPTNGIEVAALRNETVPDVADDRSNISVVRGQQLSYPSRFGLTNVTVPLDSICMYPTLAYVPNEEILNEGQSNEQHLRWGHLAWQQGADSSESIQSSGPYIMYKKIGVEWRWDSVKPLLKLNQPVEHVSQSLPGCRFYHPSIAADSLRVGVAFESRALLVPRHIPSGGSIGEIKAVTLRFRDSLKADGTSANARRWSSPAYYWGDSSNFYVYPSLTEFPIKPRADLLNTPEGALAWFNQTDGTSQWSYRYGELLPGSLPDGNYPTMMLAPAVVEDPVTQTGVLYRETDSFTRQRGWGETGTYYTARMITDETYALDGFRDIFTVLPRTSGIHAHLSIGSRLPVSSTPCNFAVVQAGLAFDHVDGGQRDTFTIVPGTFFSPPENGETWIEDPDDGSKVVRTEAFPAGTITTTIRRYIGRTSDAVTWLNTFPYDTVMLSQPDVKILTELVRVADGTVLWQDDTISVRDMTSDALAEAVTVPTDAVTPSGTMVYTRIRAVPTLDVEYLLSAGFQFYEDNTAWITSPKRSSPWQIEQQTGNEAGESILRVQIIPNPAKDRADVRVTVQNPGTVTVSIWSLLGEQLAELPPITAETTGVYTVAVDLSNVKPGVYLVKAEENGRIATSRIHVE
ncbi:MAG: T9SS type A sorting domain-containing protein [Ignavibacteria bacterium]|nr:T9SS type A sorting domain-containing protein [Ignavibacteria bacterium]